MSLKFSSVSKRKTYIRHFPEVDTRDDITDRLAAELGTLPQYIYIRNYNEQSKEFEIIDILNDTVYYAQNNNLDAALRNADEFFKIYQFALNTDDANMFIVMFRILILKNFNIGKFELSQITSAKYSSLYVYDEAYKKYSVSMSTVNIGIKVLIHKNKIDAKLEKIKFFMTTPDEYSKLKHLPHHQIKVSKADFAIPFKVDDIWGYDELLDRIRLDQNVLIASCQNTFKLYSTSIKIPQEWYMNNNDDCIYLTVKIKEANTDMNHLTRKKILLKSYTQVRIVADTEDDNDDGSKAQSFKILLSTDLPEKQRRTMIQKILKTMQLKYSVDDDILKRGGNEHGLSGIYHIPHSRVNTTVFTDMIVNDPILSSILHVDERKSASKLKRSIYFYMKVKGKGFSGIVPINITPKQITGNDGSAPRNLLYFPKNSYYLRIKIVSAKNMDISRRIQMYLYNILSLYVEHEKTYTALYTSLIPDFDIYSMKKRGAQVGRKQVKPVVQKPKKIAKVDLSKHQGGIIGSNLRTVAPHIFPVGFGRKCEADRAPIMYTKEYYDKHPELADKYTRTLESHDGNFVFTCDGEKSYNNISAIITGNPEFPYIPCCYTNTRGDKNLEKYKARDFDIKKIDTSGRKKLITNKYLDPARYGKIPGDLGRLFSVIDPTKEYIRVGTQNSRSSFLEAVLRSIDHVKIDTVEMNISKHRSKVFDTNPRYFTSGIQHRPDMSIDELVDISIGNKSVLHPYMYRVILERIFNIGIILIVRDGVDYYMDSVDHSVCEYEKKYKEYIIVYSHFGAEMDNSTRIHTEVIGAQTYLDKFAKATLKGKIKTRKIDESVPVKTLFSGKSKIIKRFLDIRNQHNNVWALNKKVRIYPEIGFSIYPVSQHIDSRGYTRRLTFEHENDRMTIYCDPIPPLTIPVDDSIHRCDNPYFDETIGVENRKVFLNRTKTKTLRMTGTIDGIYVEYHTTENTNILSEYQSQERFIRYLKEIFLWHLSKYINKQLVDSDRTELTSDVFIELVSKYKQTKISRKPGHVYGKISRIFNMSVIDNDMFVSPDSDDLIDSFVYHALNLFLKDRQTLLNYHKKAGIDNYYQTTADYDCRDKQVVFNGTAPFAILDTYSARQTVLYKPLEIYSFDPYYIRCKDPETGETSNYLAQPTSSLRSALGRHKVWEDRRINISSDVDVDLPYTLIDNNKTILSEMSNSRIVWKINVLFLKSPEKIYKDLYIALLKL